MLNSCPLAGELALDGDSEQLILIRLCLKTWLNLLIEVGTTSLWMPHSVNAELLDICFLSILLLLPYLCEKDNCLARTFYFILGNEKNFKKHMAKK